MKPFVIWATGVVTAFAALAGVTTLTRDTDQVFVVVDSSFPMQDLWRDVPSELDRIDDRQYAEFAVATTRQVGGTDMVHGYQSEIDLGAVDAFGPCAFDAIDQLPGAGAADERILVTSVSSCSTSGLDGWTIVYLDD